MAGAGLAVAGAGALASEPLGNTPPPWEVDVKQEYGAVGDGGADDAPAFQAAFSALGSEPEATGHPQGVTGARLLVPPGDYVLRSTVRIHRFAGIVQGSGIGMAHAPGTADDGARNGVPLGGTDRRSHVRDHRQPVRPAP